MTYRFAVAGSASAIALLSAGAATAEVTAQEVWDLWAGSFELYGDSVVTYDEPVMDGDALVISNMTMTMSEVDATVVSEMGEIRLVNNGDGTVAIEMPEEIRFVFSPHSEIREDDQAVLVVSYGNLETTVSGEAGALVFDFSADRQEMALESLTVEGEAIEGVAQLAINGVSGTYGLREGDLIEYDGDMAAASVEILVDYDLPEMGNVLFLSGRLDQLALDFDIAVPADFDSSVPPEEMATIFQDGLAVAIGYSTGTVAYMFNVDDGFAPASGTASAGSSETSFNIDVDSAGYSTRVTDMALAIESSDLPFPVEISAREYGLGIDVPLSSSDEPVDFSASVNITDLAINDMIWSMFDPQGQISRDPATMIVDISGTAKLLFDILDPAQAEALAVAAVPGELHSLNLDDLRISIAGGELTGGGAFTFDNSDLQTFGGMPRPEGQVGLKLTGGNGLLDTLVAMGFVGDSEAMQARMMMGMFANATGDDTLETTVEVNSQGHLIVNGQRLQ